MTESTSIFTGSFIEKFMADVAAMTDPVGPTESLDELMEEVVTVVTNPYLQRGIALFLVADAKRAATISRVRRAGTKATGPMIKEAQVASQYAVFVQQVLFAELYRLHPETIGIEELLLRQGFKIAIPIQRRVTPATVGQVVQFGRPVYTPDDPSLGAGQ